MSSLGDRALFTRLLRESVLTLCRTTMASHRYLNVDGIVCVTTGEDSDDEESTRYPIVVRIHEKLPRPSAFRSELTVYPKPRRRPHDATFYPQSHRSSSNNNYGSSSFLSADGGRRPEAMMIDHFSDYNSGRQSRGSYLPADLLVDHDIENKVPSKLPRSSINDGHCENFRQSSDKSDQDVRTHGDPFLRARSASESVLAGMQQDVADTLPPKSKSADHVISRENMQVPTSFAGPERTSEDAGSKVAAHGSDGSQPSRAALRRLACRVCEEIFLDILSLERHNLQRHSLYTCSMCTHTFTARNNLKRHARMHSGIRPFKCGTCRAAFARKDDLKTHELRHERPNVRQTLRVLERTGYSHGHLVPAVSMHAYEAVKHNDKLLLRPRKAAHVGYNEYPQEGADSSSSDLTLKQLCQVQSHNTRARSREPLEARVSCATGKEELDKGPVAEGTTTSSKKQVENEVVENLSRQYWCTECQVGFQDEATLSLHIADTHEPTGRGQRDGDPGQEGRQQQREESHDEVSKRDKPTSEEREGEKRSEGESVPVDLTGERKSSAGLEENGDKTSKQGEDSNDHEEEGAERGEERRVMGGRWITLEKPGHENMGTLKSLPMRQEHRGAEGQSDPQPLATGAGSTTRVFSQLTSAPSPAHSASPLRVNPLNLAPEKTGSTTRSMFTTGNIPVITLVKTDLDITGTCGSPPLSAVDARFDLAEGKGGLSVREKMVLHMHEKKAIDKMLLSVAGYPLSQCNNIGGKNHTKLRVKEEPKSPDREDCGSSDTSSGMSSPCDPDLPTDLSARPSLSISPSLALADGLRSGFERVVTPPILFRSRSPPLDCGICGDVFRSFAELEGHSARDHRRYLCEYCGKAFTAKPNRDRHVRYHTGERPYRCTLCPQAFFRGDDLKYHRTTKHAQVHTQLTPSLPIAIHQW